MVDQAVITMVRDIVTILGVIGGFTYYVMTVRATQRNQQLQLETRRTQLFLQLYGTITPENIQTVREINSRWSWTDVDELESKYLNEPELYGKLTSQL